MYIYITYYWLLLLIKDTNVLQLMTSEKKLRTELDELKTHLHKLQDAKRDERRENLRMKTH